ncbi:hypothetical protein HETIRDRAFT_172477 [Heterobasidion irregulare TC 32-1]|uniref:Uncharacterized protein n=1 Tax=Heterobasidion irregulare (strain TC 32-1) TaxID=747525 RepID=W4K0Q0_HETIT|nr:uncharacterized protein HETIRDRAFT_172477 [Heterobasidion irregulare TC 32-1]ETW78910.1 hypothetical protein HETIRDRAFT_172477 [Heterobasidion irregulare TC 32-1]
MWLPSSPFFPFPSYNPFVSKRLSYQTGPFFESGLDRSLITLLCDMLEHSMRDS